MNKVYRLIEAYKCNGKKSTKGESGTMRQGSTRNYAQRGQGNLRKMTEVRFEGGQNIWGNIFQGEGTASRKLFSLMKNLQYSKDF